MPLCRCSSLYQPTKLSTQARSSSSVAKPFSGHDGTYFSVLNSDSTCALSLLSAADVTDSQGNTVKTAKAVVDDADKSALIVPLEDVLPSGKYTVNWHVVAVDGHKTKGDYTFTVK
ncbi:copper resistance protein CopC [Salmonella enterica]|nr:hypothetical protein [Salmonella enterica]EBY9434138.1 hypothetical protein [Salmonella enterica subsp. enterica serovar Cerro]EGQ2009678.1 hypothetical protein [Salmonella enterica subsp. enterica serovar Infantis]EIE5051611.1 copper resistance protein CopC [Salmonella enterica subsp. enterica serovar Java]EBR6512409.1 hypothetical protein [Salmonella enterica]